MHCSVSSSTESGCLSRSGSDHTATGLSATSVDAHNDGIDVDVADNPPHKPNTTRSPCTLVTPQEQEASALALGNATQYNKAKYQTKLNKRFPIKIHYSSKSDPPFHRPSEISRKLRFCSRDKTLLDTFRQRRRRTDSDKENLGPRSRTVNVMQTLPVDQSSSSSSSSSSLPPSKISRQSSQRSKTRNRHLHRNRKRSGKSSKPKKMEKAFTFHITRSSIQVLQNMRSTIL
jgi:hypothetical protein